MNINQQLVSVTRRIATEGIGKTRNNAQQNYKFRGVDEVMNAFAPILAHEGIYLRPRFTERHCAERVNQKGTALFYVTVRGEFDFSNEAGETVTVGPFYGEAMDSGDKATNKAMAVAFKYAMFQTFCVPLEGVTDGDADGETHEVTSINQSWIDAAESVSDEDGYTKLRTEVVEKFGGDRKVPREVALALGAAKNRIAQAA